MTKAIGPNFANELAVAGLLGLSFSWSSEGIIDYSDAIAASQKAAIESVYAAHDPSLLDYRTDALAALVAGDGVATRCVKAGIAYPSAWQTYDATLRSIVRGDATGPLPTMPVYPVGT